jgi:hypothetical protein
MINDTALWRKTFHGRDHLGDLGVNNQYRNGSYRNRLFGCGLILSDSG